jgi:hypothetical protein
MGDVIRYMILPLLFISAALYQRSKYFRESAEGWERQLRSNHSNTNLKWDPWWSTHQGALTQ